MRVNDQTLGAFFYSFIQINAIILIILNFKDISRNLTHTSNCDDNLYLQNIKRCFQNYSRNLHLTNNTLIIHKHLIIHNPADLKT